MAKKPMSELEEHEPELEDSSDYNKPLSQKKFNWILLSFAIVILVYVVYAFVMNMFYQ